MSKAPIVLATTAVAFGAVLAFHPKTTGLAPGSLSTSAPPVAQGATQPPSTSQRPGATASTPSGSGSTPGGIGGASSASSNLSTTQSFTGNQVNYNYGVLSVQVTVSGKRITNVSIASLNDGGNFRSQSIDQQAIPILEQEVLQAQSARIQGVSGATYTSAGFAQSLQSALSKAGL